MIGRHTQTANGGAGEISLPSVRRRIARRLHLMIPLVDKILTTTVVRPRECATLRATRYACPSCVQQYVLFGGSSWTQECRHSAKTFRNVLICTVQNLETTWYVSSRACVVFTCALSPQQKESAGDDAPLGDNEDAAPPVGTAVGTPFSWARSTHFVFSSAICIAV